MKTEQVFTFLGALCALLSVAAGAFGAHGLKARISTELLAAFETGARYQMYHALALFAVAWGSTRWSGPAIPAAGWCFVAGIVLFSGSLYALALTDTGWLGAITPIGGVAFLIGWVCFLWGVLKSGS
jgi:uncharacterized membrane protein YgdD (TMEM256/DUF423 family)